MSYENQYSEKSLWTKLGTFAAAAGKEVIEKILILVEVIKDSNTPAWAKTAIVGALGYFISPIDAVPDVIPVIGFTDDVAVLAAAISAVAAVTKPSHISAARARLSQWFSKAAYRTNDCAGQ